MPPKKDAVVQLKSNQQGRQVGETFTASEAEELGIAEHCGPLPAQTDRAIKTGETETH